MKILVCGGRDFNDKEMFFNTLDRICEERGWVTTKSEDGNYLPSCTIISGKARGADTLAVDWAVVNWCAFEEYPADWNKYGKSAGYRRNQQMLDEGRPDLVVAFPGGKGTANMVSLAEKAGVPYILVE
jgi:hypothetical protein